MSETTPEYQTAQPTALDNLVAQRRTEASVARQANAATYAMMLSETAQLLHGSEPMTQAVLHQVCVEHNSKPGDVLSIVRDFLQTFQTYQQHEQAQPEQVAEEASPFLGRGEP